jgi:hypothetical protein
MNSPRKIVFWVVVLLLVIGGGVVLERAFNKGSLKQGKSQKILPFSPEDVVKLWVVTKGKKLTIAKTASGGWRYVGMTEIPCDKSAVDALINSVVSSKYDAVLFEDPTEAKLEELGLSEPHLKIGFATSDAEAVIVFGNKGPTNNITYAMVESLPSVGSPRVLRVHSDLATTSNKTISELRDKSILSFEPLNVTRLEIRRTSKGKYKDVVLIEQPQPSLWKITSSSIKEGNARLEAVLETLYMLRDSKVLAFIADMPGFSFGTKPTDYGLKGSDISVSITTRSAGGAIERATLVIGNEGSSRDGQKSGYYASRGNSKGVVLVSDDFVEHLKKEPSFWVD